MTVAALALAAAVLVLPTTPRRRLGAAPPRRRCGGRRAAVIGVAAGAVTCVVVFPAGVAAAAGVAAGTLWLRRRSAALARARTAEAVELQGGLAVLIGELRIGAHPVLAVAAAARESRGTVGSALAEVAARARLGADVGAGLGAVATGSSAGAYWQRLAESWRLAAEYGLAVGALLRTAERDIVERERFASRVRAGMAGARATAVILAALPALGIGLGHLIGAEPLSLLLSDGWGGWLLCAGTVLVCLGLAWSDRIVAQVLP